MKSIYAGIPQGITLFQLFLLLTLYSYKDTNYLLPTLNKMSGNGYKNLTAI